MKTLLNFEKAFLGPAPSGRSPGNASRRVSRFNIKLYFTRKRQPVGVSRTRSFGTVSRERSRVSVSRKLNFVDLFRKQHIYKYAFLEASF